jgi:hypothetical protein
MLKDVQTIAKCLNSQERQQCDLKRKMDRI